MFKRNLLSHLKRHGKTCLLMASLALGNTIANAQVSSYAFFQSAGTYAPITGGTVIAAATDADPGASESTCLDDLTITNVSIPFTFSFNGAPFTSLNVNTNGWVSFTGAALGTTTGPITSTTDFNVISPFGTDLMGVFATTGDRTSGSAVITNVTNTSMCVAGAAIQGSGIPSGTTISSFTANSITLSAAATATSTGTFLSFTTGEIRTQILGTAPNRTFVIQYKGMSQFASSFSSSSNLNNSCGFQIRLSEANGVATSQKITVVYGNCFRVAGTQTCQMGLKGNGNTDFNIRTSTTTWSATTAGTANSDVMTWSSTVTAASGQTYAWAPPSCIAPGTISVPAATLMATSAAFNWTIAPGSPIGYQWEIRTSGLAGSGATGLTASGSTTSATNASNSSLTPNTSYSLFVRSQCSATTFSGWSAAVAFTTPCSPSPTPFLEAFEGTTFVPSCWQQATGNLGAPTTFLASPNNNWNQQNFGDVSASSSTNKSARINIFGSTSRRDWLITPPIDLGTTPKQLEFDMALTAFFSPTATALGTDDTVAVVISTDNGATWTTANILQQWGSSTPIANGSGNHVMINLTAYTGVVKIGFYGASTVSNADNDLFIDNVKVDAIPACQIPTNVTVSAITATTATITWTPSATASPAGYQWEVRTSGLAGSGATGLAASGSTVTPVVTANVSSLTPGTTYSVYIRTNCGAASFSTWTSASVFNTLCGVFTVPFLQAFEATTFVPLCWMQATGNLAASTTFAATPNNNWNQSNYGDANVSTATSTNKSARINIFGTSRRDWLITPSIDLGTTPKQLEFDIALTPFLSSATATLGVDDTVAVVISTNNGTTWSNANILKQWGSTTPIANGTGNHISIDLTPYTGIVKIGFYGASTVSNTDNDLFIDNVSVKVNACPVVNLGADVTTCNTGTFQQVLDAGNPGATYLWDNGNTTQTRTVTTSGTYFVDVTQGTCTKRDSLIVTLKPAPVVNLGNDTAICAGNTLTLNAGNAGATYLWSNNATTQTISATTAGIYFVKVTGTNGCSKTDTLIMALNVNPVVNLGNDTAICAGKTLTLNAGNAGATYLWNNSATTQTVNATTAGTYFVKVTNANSCVKTDTLVMTVNANPVVNLGNDTALCMGDTIVLHATSTGVTYLWDNGSSAATRSVGNSGTYYVALTNANACIGRDTIVVTTNSLPVVNLGNDTSICTGTSLTLDAGNAGATYLWDNASVAQTRTADAAGHYFVSVSDAHGCKASDSVNIAVIPLPSGDMNIAANGGGTYTFTATNTANVTSISWNFGDAGIAPGSPVQHTYMANGNYTVSLTLTGECGDTTITKQLTVSGIVGIGHITLGNDQLDLYPNPAASVLNIRNLSGLDMLTVSAYNVLGQRVYQAVADDKNKHQMNISALPSGIYTLKIATTKGWIVRKFEVIK